MKNETNKKNSKGIGKLPSNVVRRHIQIKSEHIRLLKQEADDRFEGNLSMLIRHILDKYIAGRDCVDSAVED